MGFIESVKQRAAKRNKRIVLPEGEDERIIKAAAILDKEKIARVVLLGNENEIRAKSLKLGVQLGNIPVVEPSKSSELKRYAAVYYEKRKHKGITQEEAREIVKDPMFFGAAMVEAGNADGSVAGAAHATADTVRAALHLIGMAPGFSIVSSFFIMISPDKSFGKEGLMVFADCAVVPQPNAVQLGEIAIASAENARFFLETEPLIAMLSFSTKGSAEHPDVDKVIEAMKIVKERRPELQVDGEMQFDAAVIPSIGERKSPGSKVAGRANTFIFPDLDAANTGYKIAQRMGRAEAVGPFLQGLRLPCNDLSRGCSVDDIVNTSAVTAIQADMSKR